MLETILENVRKTRYDKLLGVIRIFIGIIIGSTGIMKLTVPMLGNAWSGQLIQANIPLYSFNVWFVPIVEIVVGAKCHRQNQKTPLSSHHNSTAPQLDDSITTTAQTPLF